MTTLMHVDQVQTGEQAAELLGQLGRRISPSIDPTWVLRTVDDEASDRTAQLLEITIAYYSAYRGRQESHVITVIEHGAGGRNPYGEGEAWCEQIAVAGLLTDDDVWRLLDLRGRIIRARRVEL